MWGTTNPVWVERNRKAGHISEVVTVPRVDMDEAFRRFGVPHYLKIDVEGVDTVVLEALLRQTERPTYISLESAMGSYSDLEGEFDLLERLGYSSFNLLQQETVPGTLLQTTDLRGGPLAYTFSKHASGPFGADLPTPWWSRAEVLQSYYKVFAFYRLFGSDSVLRRLFGARVLRVLSRVFRRPLPGWYDTHARIGPGFVASIGV